jgi:mono/diheme cytochrome c family protein
MKIISLFGLLTLVCGCLALAACGGGKTGNTGKKGGSTEKEDIRRMPVPQEYKDLKPPDLTDKDLIAKGKDLFHAADKGNCVSCHGEKGKGDGPAGKTLDPKPRDLTSSEFQDAKNVTPQYIFWRLKDVAGSKAYPTSGMLGYPNGSDEDRWALVAYVLSLKGK